MTIEHPIPLVGYATEDLKPLAQSIAARIQGIVDKDASSCVFVAAEGLSLKLPHFSPLTANFSLTHWSQRKAEGKKQALVRACKPGPGARIIDATGGWGRDAAVLASFGAEVLMLERHPIMALLLEDALARRSEADKASMQISLYPVDAIDYLQTLSERDYPDIIYIDPMHPKRMKSALVKKDLQALQQLIGEDQDAETLIQLARSRVRSRVVVKWPQKLHALVASHERIAGKTVGFDIYLPLS